MHNKGIKVDLSEEGIKVEVYCVMNFGVSIPQVAQQIQDNIRQTLINMTGLVTEEVNIHIVGVQFESTKQESELQQEM